MGDPIPDKSKTARVKQAIARLLDAAKLQPHAQAAKSKAAAKSKTTVKPSKGKAK